ncbi:Dissimilatory sulfite reductase, gamma subunit [gamma proteobacterium HdN1]|nr:Dissimilatory sulfite reductase, gamma subunit [gamma proteobacterium HdN1]
MPSKTPLPSENAADPNYKAAPPLDKEGYLKNLSDWSPEAATWIAEKEGITLTDAHWEVIQLLRAFYNAFDHAPNNRVLVKYCAQNLGAERVSSAWLMQLFGGSPAKTAAKLAGLPRPTHCL